ncbi:glycosyltransferase [Candidatus Pacearchaeota archaeon]|nr:glycosyltransferase [Candidatus Pacearchaeota archaeon]
MGTLKTILQTSSVGRPITPNLKYGGTARVIIYLDREFTRLGYDSLVAATGDSRVIGRLIETVPRSISLWNMDGERNAVIKPRKEHDELSEKHYQIILETILKYKNIDIVHDHPGSGLISSKKFREVGDQIKTPILVTLHGAFSDRYAERYTLWNKVALEKGNIYFNAISHSQKRAFEERGFRVSATIYHGIPIEYFPFRNEKLDYLFSLGRICPKKGQHTAIQIAKETGMPLIIGGEVNSAHNNYWKENVESYLDFSITEIPEKEHEDYKNNLVEKLNAGENIIDEGQIIFVGNLDDRQKIAFYERAKAFMMPINWPEPFGLTMIESMACGTPVIAYSVGSVPEVIKDGKTGFIVEKTGNEEIDLAKMIEAVNNIVYINPKDCRKHIAENFSITREAKDYLNLYKKLLGNFKYDA